MNEIEGLDDGGKILLGILLFIDSKKSWFILILAFMLALALFLWKKDIENCTAYYRPLIQNCSMIIEKYI